MFRQVTPCLQRETRAGLHEAAVAGWDRDGDPGRHERPAAAGRELGVLAGAEVVAGVVVVLLRRERELGVEPGDRDLHASGDYGARSRRRAPSRCSSVSSVRSWYSGWSITMLTGPSANAARWASVNSNFR